VSARALLWPRRAATLLLAAQGLDACVMGGVASACHRILSRPKAASMGVPADEPPWAAAPDPRALAVEWNGDILSRELAALAGR